MKFIAALAAVSGVAAIAVAPAPAAATSSYVVTLKAIAGTAQCTYDRAAVNARYGITPTVLYDTVFCGEAAKLTGHQVKALRSDTRVRSVEPDTIVRGA